MHTRTDQRDIRRLQGICELLGIDEAQLLRATAGEPFRMDFGRDRDGDRLTFFYRVELLQWARRTSGLRVAA